MRWLTVCSRQSLRERTWSLVRDSWRQIVTGIRSQDTYQLAENLAAVLDAGTGTTAEFASVVLIGARATGVALHRTTETMLQTAADA
jgi:hypothetical protein